MRTDHAGIGGPNIAAAAATGRSPTASPTRPAARSTSCSPTSEAEHIPGCNMAFRKDRLEAIGGFDPQFRVAGDDVDVCWRLQERGWTLGFSPAAMVWHHRRNSVRAYWKQQQGYGKAEALLERKWPERYNARRAPPLGRTALRQGTDAKRLGRGEGRIYGGTWGTAPFQSVYQPAPRIAGVACRSCRSGTWSSLPSPRCRPSAPLAAALSGPPTARLRHHRAPAPGRVERGKRLVPGPTNDTAHPAEAVGPDGIPAPAAAAGAAARPPCFGSRRGDAAAGTSVSCLVHGR